MTKRLPDYSSDEVRGFHPFFEEALNASLATLGLTNTLEVVHHWSTRGFSGIVDFVIRNRVSRKVLLPIEVKKTPFDLRALGRKQARRYWEELGDYRGSDFYMATNLEEVELFRHSSDRRLTLAQLVDTERREVGRFGAVGYEDFFELLHDSLVECIQTLHANDGTKYASNVSGLMHALEYSTQDLESWHQAQAYYAFDYIKGALIRDEVLGGIVDDWMSAIYSIESPRNLASLTSKIDFDVIFEKPIEGRFNAAELRQIVAGAFEAGMRSDGAQDLNLIVNELAVSRTNIKGVVETEQPLASLLLSQAAELMSTWGVSEPKIFEPGCGSGNLLLAAKRQFHNLKASDIFGLEKEELFREVLGLRVGLAFVDSLRVGCRPALRIADIKDVQREEISSSNLVIMNPPFIRGIDAVEEKASLALRIQELTGAPAKLTVGQLGYECAFLEQVVALAQPGTFFAIIFPKNALTRPQSSAVRRFLLHDLGLQQIVIYDANSAFSGVQKSTVILLGRKGYSAEEIKISRCGEQLVEASSADSGESRASETNSSQSDTFVPSSDLSTSATGGWKEFIESNSNDYIEFMLSLADLHLFKMAGDIHSISRGGAGNSGGSDFIFGIKSDAMDVAASFNPAWGAIPEQYIVAGVKNSDVAPRVISDAIDQVALLIPDSALTEGKISAALSNYVDHASARIASGSQGRKPITHEKIAHIVRTTQATQGYYVLVPRASRANGQISYSLKTEAVVSTNFVIVRCDSELETLFQAAWLLSVFGQMQLEALGVDQEGMRKVEVSQIKSVMLPDLSMLVINQIKDLSTLVEEAEPLRFNDLRMRPIDQFLGDLVFGSAGPNLTEQAFSILELLISNRLGEN